MRMERFAAITMTAVLLALTAPVSAAVETQPTNTDSGWSGVIYPIYGWLPIHRADVRFPDLPEGKSDANLDQAFLAAFRLEKGRFALEGGYLYAGLSGEIERPAMKLEVDADMVDLMAGYEVAPAFYLEGGVRWLSLDAEAAVAGTLRRSWDTSPLQPVIGLTYRPLIGRNWRLILHGDFGGLTGDNTTAAAVAKVEWQPARHFLLVAGGTVRYVSTEKEIAIGTVKLDQTLYGPIIGFGIPF